MRKNCSKSSAWPPKIVGKIPVTRRPMSRLFRIKNELRALGCRLLSYWKEDWLLTDYPLYFCEQITDDKGIFQPPRFILHRYAAEITHWTLSGYGNSKEEALSDLEMRFMDRIAQGEKPPRPGKVVPVAFANSSRVDAHQQLAEDFIQRILELEDVWISDESSLWDFHTDKTNEYYLEKIQEIYGIQVDDIPSARLCEIFEKIASESPQWR